MEMQQTYRAGFGAQIAAMRLDGLGGQEDELDDVSKGKLDPHSEAAIKSKQTPSDKSEVDDEEIQADLETRTPG